MDFDFIEERLTRGSKIYGMVQAFWITGYFSVVVFGNSSITSKLSQEIKKRGIINPFLFISFSFVFF